MSITLVFAAVLAVITVTIGRIRWLERILPAYRWGSLAAGVSTAYVFVELLPELTHADHLLQSFFPHFAYILALGGLVLFYILDVLAQKSRTSDGGTSAAVFRVHIGFVAAYHFLIGELLVDIAGRGLTAALIFCVVLIFHFYIMDNTLRTHHRARYDTRGRWVLAAALFAGAAVGSWRLLPAPVLAGMWAVAAGALILLTLNAELPDSKQTCLTSFVAGAGAITAALLLTALSSA